MEAQTATSTLPGEIPAEMDYALLTPRLSSGAQVIMPSAPNFAARSARWTALKAPKVDVIVAPYTEDDVVKTVEFANEHNVPFLAYSSGHGNTTTLGKMQRGILLDMSQLKSVSISREGNTAMFGGGVLAKDVIDALWKEGKQTVTGVCECVSLLGPGLGGGHGFLQGQHGLVADQFISMNVVLADGTLTLVDETSDLWWAMRGAGHNFGIVTSVTTKIYDVEHPNWALEQYIFDGDKVEVVYEAMNKHLVQNQPVDIMCASFYNRDPSIDPEKPIITVCILQEGVTSVTPTLTAPFRALSPLNIKVEIAPYSDISACLGFGVDAPSCQKVGLTWKLFPVYLDTFDVPTQRKMYDYFAELTSNSSPFQHSLFLFDGYPTHGVRIIPAESSAFPHRDSYLLCAPAIVYEPAGPERDEEARVAGERIRSMMYEGSGGSEGGVLKAYVNYAYGNEEVEEMYGAEEWRLERLRVLKRKYDPMGRFSFYGPLD